MKRLAIFVAILALPACTTATNQKVATVAQRAVVDGQLFCAVATKTSPIVVAVATASGAPVTVIGATAAAVAAACSAINGIPVVPPVDPAAAPVVAAPVTKGLTT